MTGSEYRRCGKCRARASDSNAALCKADMQLLSADIGKHAYQENISADEVPELVCLRQICLIALCQRPLALFIHADVCIWLWGPYWLLCSSLGHGQGNISWGSQGTPCTTPPAWPRYEDYRHMIVLLSDEHEALTQRPLTSGALSYLNWPSVQEGHLLVCFDKTSRSSLHCFHIVLQSMQSRLAA